jgi:hypothetical protein
MGSVRLDEGIVRVQGAEGGHEISAERLAAIVTGIQRTVRLLAAQEEGVPVSRRFKPSRDLRDHYTLVLGVPEAGSYAQPMAVVDTRETATLTDPAGFFPLQAATGVLAAIQRDDRDAVLKAVPHPRIRRSILEGVVDFLPIGEDTLELAAGSLTASLDAMTREMVQHWLSLEGGAVETDIVGELIAIKFETKTITLKFPPTGTHLEAHYDIDLEETLFGERRGMVQVSGTVFLDDEACPIELLEVTAIRLVDLSPIAIRQVRHGGVRLDARVPFEITPTLSEDDHQLFEARDEPLGIDTFASTREKLIEALDEEIAFMWECYALEDPAQLSSGAQALRTRLLAAFQVV